MIEMLIFIINLQCYFRKNTNFYVKYLLEFFLSEFSQGNKKFLSFKNSQDFLHFYYMRLSKKNWENRKINWQYGID
jgi:hypothetical protein